MSNYESITKSPFYEIVCILDELGNLDFIKRADLIHKRPVMLSHEEYFLQIKNLLLGIISAISYMQLSVLHIQRKHDKQYFLTHGYIDYSVYRYHYYVFCHGIVTLHDIYFKLISEICDLDIGSRRMIQWDDLKKMLLTKNEGDIVNLLEDFYTTIKDHEQKRNTVSHEGFLTSPLIENYYTTHIWTNAHNKNNEENEYPQFTEGTKENKFLIGKTQKKLVDELNKLIDASINYTLSLFDMLLPKLIDQVDIEFINSHMDILLGMNNENANKYFLPRVGVVVGEHVVDGVLRIK